MPTANFINATTAYNKISAFKHDTPTLPAEQSFTDNTNSFNQVFQTTLNNYNNIISKNLASIPIVSYAPSNIGIMSSLASLVSNLRYKLEKSERISNKAAVKKADLTDLVTNVSEAELHLQEIVYMRDKLVGIYKEIMLMQI